MGITRMNDTVLKSEAIKKKDDYRMSHDNRKKEVIKERYITRITDGKKKISSRMADNKMTEVIKMTNFTKMAEEDKGKIGMIKERGITKMTDYHHQTESISKEDFKERGIPKMTDNHHQTGAFSKEDFKERGITKMTDNHHQTGAFIKEEFNRTEDRNLMAEIIKKRGITRIVKDNAKTEVINKTEIINKTIFKRIANDNPKLKTIQKLQGVTRMPQDNDKTDISKKTFARMGKGNHRSGIIKKMDFNRTAADDNQTGSLKRSIGKLLISIKEAGLNMAATANATQVGAISVKPCLNNRPKIGSLINCQIQNRVTTRKIPNPSLNLKGPRQLLEEE